MLTLTLLAAPAIPTILTILDRRTTRAAHVSYPPPLPRAAVTPLPILTTSQELSKIAPVLEAARAAVGGIKSDNLNEIRSLKMPPEAIRDVLEGVLRIMGNYDTSWISMKRFLGT